MEMLIVIAIITILAGALVPMFSQTRLSAARAKATADLDTIKTAAVMFYNDTGSWPATGTAGNGLINNTGAPAGWNGPYLEDTSLLDPWKTNNYEIYDGTSPTRRIRSWGPNKAQGGTPDDDITMLMTSNTLR